MSQLTLSFPTPVPQEIPLLDETATDHTTHCRSFADELFPTPKETIAKMIEPYVVRSSILGNREYLKINGILDPSAGKGDILDYLKKRFGRSLDDRLLHAVEIVEDLRHVLRDKGYTVLDADFLGFSDPIKFDLIVMNPPFSAGTKHLLHAWEFLDYGGDLVCLLNQETIDNPYTQDRKYLLNLIELYGSVEELGSCFEESERPTQVRVAMVRLKRPKLEAGYDFEGVRFSVDSKVDFDNFGKDQLADRSIIKALVTHYECARELLIDRHRSQSKLSYHLGRSISSDCFKQSASFTEQIAALKAIFWESLFSETKLASKMNSSFQRNFSNFCRDQKQMSFNVANIYEVIEQFFLNREEIMLQGIVEIFDKTIALHEDNRIGEGWKTNSSFRVNRKIIHPWGVTYDKDFGFTSWRCRNLEYTLDLDKSMAYLAGVSEYVSISEAIKQHIDSLDRGGRFDNQYAQVFSSTFFDIKIFKKGTVHLKFRDTKIWEQFNLAAARGKKWLGQEESDFTKRQ